jgi:hypothetical protein
MHIIGRGRYRGETYPSPPNAATVALRNRNVAGVVALVAPFTPSASGGIIAAILFTPKVSGVVQVSATLAMTNGATPDDYTTIAYVVPGTGLSVTGGASTINGWVVGSTVPPLIGGVTGAPMIIGSAIAAIAGGASGTLLTFGISQPLLPVGVPVVIFILLAEVGGGHALADLGFINLSVLELP